MSGAAILRRQTTGTITMTNARKMFDESQMVRRVRAYLASIKSNIVTDEDYLLEMSNQCEASAQHSAPQPGQLSLTDHGRRHTQKSRELWKKCKRNANLGNSYCSCKNLHKQIPWSVSI